MIVGNITNDLIQRTINDGGKVYVYNDTEKVEVVSALNGVITMESSSQIFANNSQVKFLYEPNYQAPFSEYLDTDRDGIIDLHDLDHDGDGEWDDRLPQAPDFLHLSIMVIPDAPSEVGGDISPVEPLEVVCREWGKAIIVDRYYPLYVTLEEALLASRCTPPSAHAHTLDSREYYMPECVNQFHGNYHTCIPDAPEVEYVEAVETYDFEYVDRAMVDNQHSSIVPRDYIIQQLGVDTDDDGAYDGSEIYSLVRKWNVDTYTNASGAIVEGEYAYNHYQTVPEQSWLFEVLSVQPSEDVLSANHSFVLGNYVATLGASTKYELGSEENLKHTQSILKYYSSMLNGSQAEFNTDQIAYGRKERYDELVDFNILEVDFVHSRIILGKRTLAVGERIYIASSERVNAVYDVEAIVMSAPNAPLDVRGINGRVLQPALEFARVLVPPERPEEVKGSLILAPTDVHVLFPPLVPDNVSAGFLPEVPEFRFASHTLPDPPATIDDKIGILPNKPSRIFASNHVYEHWRNTLYQPHCSYLMIDIIDVRRKQAPYENMPSHIGRDFTISSSGKRIYNDRVRSVSPHPLSDNFNAVQRIFDSAVHPSQGLGGWRSHHAEPSAVGEEDYTLTALPGTLIGLKSNRYYNTGNYGGVRVGNQYRVISLGYIYDVDFTLHEDYVFPTVADNSSANGYVGDNQSNLLYIKALTKFNANVEADTYYGVRRLEVENGKTSRLKFCDKDHNTFWIDLDFEIDFTDQYVGKEIRWIGNNGPGQSFHNLNNGDTTTITGIQEGSNRYIADTSVAGNGFLFNQYGNSWEFVEPVVGRTVDWEVAQLDPNSQHHYKIGNLDGRSASELENTHSGEPKWYHNVQEPRARYRNEFGELYVDKSVWNVFKLNEQFKFYVEDDPTLDVSASLVNFNGNAALTRGAGSISDYSGTSPLDARNEGFMNSHWNLSVVFNDYTERGCLLYTKGDTIGMSVYHTVDEEGNFFLEYNVVDENGVNTLTMPMPEQAFLTPSQFGFTLQYEKDHTLDSERDDWRGYMKIWYQGTKFGELTIGKNPLVGDTDHPAGIGGCWIGRDDEGNFGKFKLRAMTTHRGNDGGRANAVEDGRSLHADMENGFDDIEGVVGGRDPATGLRNPDRNWSVYGGGNNETGVSANRVNSKGVAQEGLAAVQWWFATEVNQLQEFSDFDRSRLNAEGYVPATSLQPDGNGGYEQINPDGAVWTSFNAETRGGNNTGEDPDDWHPYSILGLQPDVCYLEDDPPPDPKCVTIPYCGDNLIGELHPVTGATGNIDVPAESGNKEILGYHGFASGGCGNGEGSASVEITETLMPDGTWAYEQVFHEQCTECGAAPEEGEDDTVCFRIGNSPYVTCYGPNTPSDSRLCL